MPALSTPIAGEVKQFGRKSLSIFLPVGEQTATHIVTCAWLDRMAGTVGGAYLARCIEEGVLVRVGENEFVPAPSWSDLSDRDQLICAIASFNKLAGSLQHDGGVA